MKKFYLTLLLLVFATVVWAQHIAVKDFYYAENDLTARTYGTSLEDQNGNLCALIKVETTEKGVWAFDVGMLGVAKTEMQNAEHPAEIWVYVPFSVLWITLQHEQLGKLNHYRFPCNIEKGCTYVMTLETTSSPVPPSPGIRQQYLAFQISPANAALEVNDRIWEVDADGNAQEFVNFGNYTYRVQAPNYHTEVGKVTVDDPDNTKFVKVTLNPNFGWIEVAGTGDLQGASVYIDNAMVGKAPCKSEALKSGQHNVRIAKKMYATYSETVTVNDNETTRLAPTLAADFAEVTLTVDADAEIWVNNEKKGTRTWTGPLGSGSYKIECKLANHETSLTTKEIAAAMNGQTITLPAPIPIYGSLMVESTPKFCKLYLDGKDMGTTPKSINEILIGQHEIRLTQDGYADYRETVTIAKGERKQVKATLSADGSTPMAVKPQEPQPAQPEQPNPQQPTTSKKETSAFFVMANAAYSLAPQTSFGLTVGSVKRWGWYASVGTNFKYIKAGYSCAADGTIYGIVNNNYYYYTNEETMRLSVTAGAVSRIAKPVYAYLGAGYGLRNLLWHFDGDMLADVAKNTAYSHEGLALEAGMMFHVGRFSGSLGVQTVNFGYVEAKLGLGMNF